MPSKDMDINASVCTTKFNGFTSDVEPILSNVTNRLLYTTGIEDCLFHVPRVGWIEYGSTDIIFIRAPPSALVESG